MSKEGINRKENRRTAECRMSNVEGRNSIDFIKRLSKAKPPFDTCPPRADSAVHYSSVLRTLGHVFSVIRFSLVLRFAGFKNR